jgi:hypothetical protein
VWVSSEHTFGAAETLKPHGENHMKYRQFLMAFAKKCGIAARTPDRHSFSASTGRTSALLRANGS